MQEKSFDYVAYQDFKFPEKLSIKLKCGAELSNVTLRYETYGQLNQDRSNAILIEHALSGNHHAAGKYSANDKWSGWWDKFIGPGRAIDTNKYFVICSNLLGGCSGSTGPSSINPATNDIYGVSFPIITIGDMVHAQIHLIEYLGIDVLHSIVGSSMGGMLSLYWSVHYPKKLKSAVVIASTTAQSAQAIAFSEVGRQVIIRDNNWNQGFYRDKEVQGLSIARMMAHITYLSDESMRNKFGRHLQDKKTPDFTFDTEFQIESYLHHQGNKFLSQFDANSYLYMTKAMNYFDLSNEFGSLEKAFEKASASFLVVSFSSDWLYPSYMSKEMVKAMSIANRDVSYVEIQTNFGHDAFLLEIEKISFICKPFLESIQ